LEAVKALGKAWGITEGRAADCLADPGWAAVAWEPCSCPAAQTLHPDEAIWGHFAASCREAGWVVRPAARAGGGRPLSYLIPAATPISARRGVGHFLNWTRKACVLPSLSASSNCAHVPAQFELVFQT
jgi:hypothetical protein